MAKLSFKPKAVTKKLISEIGDRPRDILSQRFGIGDFDKKKTLEAIGKTYGITRERVRQIENFSINSIKESKAFQTLDEIFAELKESIAQKGNVVKEDDLLNFLSDDVHAQNHLHFLLVLGDDFTKLKEDEDFYHRWTTDPEVSGKIHQALNSLHKIVKEKDSLTEEEVLVQLKDQIKTMIKQEVKEEVLRTWLDLSKIVDKNPLGEWGYASSPNIKPRGMTDYAFLILRKEGTPLRFTEVADKILDIFSKKAHPATVHNGLIKDDRFVLVGRGLYALKDWGYQPGAVKDIIKNILKKNGPLTKDEIMKLVSKERYVKESTILVNLQNKEYFKKIEGGKYKAI